MDLKYLPVIIAILVSLYTLPSVASVPQSTGKSPNWIFMVYMDADNTLADYAADDLAEMMSYGSNNNITIIVLYDSTSNGDSAIYKIEKGKKVLLKNLGEVDMGDGATLEYFLNWTYKNYHGKHYFLDLWDHGSYYTGVCLDHGDWLTLEEIKKSLEKFNIIRGKRLEVLGFDACRMGGIEIYYALANTADYIVASEKDEPANGWPYYDILSKIEDKNPENASKLVVDSVYNWARRFYTQEGLSVIMASVNTSRIPRFIKDFNTALNNTIPLGPYLSDKIINATKDVERYELHSVVDLYDLMEKIESIHDYKLSILARITKENIENMTYAKAWDCPHPANGYHVRNAHGIGIYFPSYTINPEYYFTDFAKDSLWDEFLDSIFYPQTIKRASGRVNYTIVEDTLLVKYSSNSSYVEIYVENITNGYSGIIGPEGKFSIAIGYGSFTIFIYGYNKNGTVNWYFREHITRMRKIYVVGKIYINGYLAQGARLKITVGNHSICTIQNESGFNITLYYPEQIQDNSTIDIELNFGYIHRVYECKLGILRGSTITQIVIKDQITPNILQMISISTILTILVFVIIRKLNRSV